MLWLEGQTIQPGIKVLSGPFDWQSAQATTIPQEISDVVRASLYNIQENICHSSEPVDDIPDLTTVHYTTVVIESTQKRATLPQNVILAHIYPATTKDQEVFQQAASCMREQLVDAWMAWAETQAEQDLSTNRSRTFTNNNSCYSSFPKT